MLRKFILIFSLLTAADSTAFAQSDPQTYPGTPEEQAACRPDAARFCRGISDVSEVRVCLISHRRQLTSHCRRVLQRHGY
jgi:hypothetical protein